MTCECKPVDVYEMQPWTRLDLNFSSALDPVAIQRAFKERAKVLAPDHNLGCLHLASREYIAARRARDTLMLLAEQPKRLKPMPTTPLSVRGAAAGRQPRGRNLGSQISLLVAIKLALYRMFRDQRSKLVHGWWSRARSFVGETVRTAHRVLTTALRFFRENAGSLLLIVMLSLAALPLSLA